MNNKIVGSAKKIARIGVMSATLIVGKFALSFIPNVEVITTLIIVYGVVFGFESVFATLIFCTADVFIYPPSLDVIISYYVYFNSLSLLSATLSGIGIKNKSCYLAIAIVMTVLFGVITSFFYSLLFSVNFFGVYLAGLLYYAIHVVSTVVFMSVGFTPLKKILTKIKENGLKN
ncbi:MAG: hypothetical protein J6Q58_03270 [Clostridia bacterium]|nr:hypothetical protein [Clostridia bacterium]